MRKKKKESIKRGSAIIQSEIITVNEKLVTDVKELRTMVFEYMKESISSVDEDEHEDGEINLKIEKKEIDEEFKKVDYFLITISSSSQETEENELSKSEIESFQALKDQWNEFHEISPTSTDRKRELLALVENRKGKKKKEECSDDSDESEGETGDELEDYYNTSSISDRVNEGVNNTNRNPNDFSELLDEYGELKVHEQDQKKKVFNACKIC